jgi:hypothetical protein
VAIEQLVVSRIGASGTAAHSSRRTSYSELSPTLKLVLKGFLGSARVLLTTNCRFTGWNSRLWIAGFVVADDLVR